MNKQKHVIDVRITKTDFKRRLRFEFILLQFVIYHIIKHSLLVRSRPAAEQRQFLGTKINNRSARKFVQIADPRIPTVLVRSDRAIGRTSYANN